MSERIEKIIATIILVAGFISFIIGLNWNGTAMGGITLLLLLAGLVMTGTIQSD